MDSEGMPASSKCCALSVWRPNYSMLSVNESAVTSWTRGPPVDYEECEEASNVVLALVGLGWMPKLKDTLGLDPSVSWSARPERFELPAF